MKKRILTLLSILLILCSCSQEIQVSENILEVPELAETITDTSEVIFENVKEESLTTPVEPPLKLLVRTSARSFQVVERSFDSEFTEALNLILEDNIINFKEEVAVNNLNFIVDKKYEDSEFRIVSILINTSNKTFVKNCKITDSSRPEKVKAYNFEGDPYTVNFYYKSLESQDVEVYNFVVEDISEEQEIRPENLKSSSIKGVYLYDTYGYSSSKLRKSYLIDSNGNYFEVNNLSIKNRILFSEDYGLVKVDFENKVVKEYLTENMIVYTYFKDRYNQVYIHTKDQNYINEDIECIYFNQIGRYIPTEEGSTILLDYGEENYIGSMYDNPLYGVVKAAQKGEVDKLVSINPYLVKEDFSIINIPEDFSTDINYRIFTDRWYEEDYYCPGFEVFVDNITNGVLSVHSFENESYKGISWCAAKQWSQKDGWKRSPIRPFETYLKNQSLLNSNFIVFYKNGNLYIMKFLNEDGSYTEVYNKFYNEDTITLPGVMKESEESFKNLQGIYKIRENIDYESLKVVREIKDDGSTITLISDKSQNFTITVSDFSFQVN